MHYCRGFREFSEMPMKSGADHSRPRDVGGFLSACFGLLLIAFIWWASSDSEKNYSGCRIGSWSVSSEWRGIVIDYWPGAARASGTSWGLQRLPHLTASPDIALRDFQIPILIHQQEVSLDRQYLLVLRSIDEKLRLEEELAIGMAGLDPRSWRWYVPYWLVLLFLLGIGSCLFVWKAWRRRRRKIMEPGLGCP